MVNQFDSKWDRCIFYCQSFWQWISLNVSILLSITPTVDQKNMYLLLSISLCSFFLSFALTMDQAKYVLFYCQSIWQWIRQMHILLSIILTVDQFKCVYFIVNRINSWSEESVSFIVNQFDRGLDICVHFYCQLH